MDILKDLWHGNVQPHEQFVRGDGEYFAALRKEKQEKERLFLLLSAEQQAALESLLDIQSELNLVGEEKAFAAGFRLAVQLLTESVG